MTFFSKLKGNVERDSHIKIGEAACIETSTKVTNTPNTSRTWTVLDLKLSSI